MMQYDVAHNLRVSPIDGRRPTTGRRTGAPWVRVSVTAIKDRFRDEIVTSLREIGALFELRGQTVEAVLPGNRVEDLALSWKSVAVMYKLGMELSAGWEPLPGKISTPIGVLDYSQKPLVMGILNITPDSFYSPSRRSNIETVVDTALFMAEQGADLVDLGGESTRPGAEPVHEADEMRRVIPAIERIVKIGGPPISIDTSKAAVAAAALDSGAVLVNDVSGLRDPRLGELVADRQVPLVMMHSRGSSRTMQQSPYFVDTVGEVLRELKERINIASGLGVARHQLIVDPGIGFGKRPVDNLRLLQGLSQLRALGPVLIGVSRKSFLGHVLKLPVEERLLATTIANAVAVVRGADILRVHDVEAANQVVKLVSAMEVSEEGDDTAYM